ncbi:hypothetical protein SAMN06269185_0028 [Natronoarchaeum philippinense]|uniref:Uncharacterized protein n=1 Tax=Natronoarchaeum philippinense TaxID=558529 RepID=A0A285MZ46_NATPI|nr:hypothetical protein [Natronoarchaeum philippinense]SNZ02462.1 hypothetical protein SAMN06269185_0028 [Natronoarchaeum philippinense]
MVLASIVVFVVSLLIGGLGIYFGAKVVVDVEDYTYAIGTALIGGLLWAIIEFFVPLVGGLLAFFAYLWIINRRYPGGWIEAILIALVAWLAVTVVFVLLAILLPGINSGLSAFGVPA